MPPTTRSKLRKQAKATSSASASSSGSSSSQAKSPARAKRAKKQKGTGKPNKSKVSKAQKSSARKKKISKQTATSRQGKVTAPASSSKLVSTSASASASASASSSPPIRRTLDQVIKQVFSSIKKGKNTKRPLKKKYFAGAQSATTQLNDRTPQTTDQNIHAELKALAEAINAGVLQINNQGQIIYAESGETIKIDEIKTIYTASLLSSDRRITIKTKEGSNIKTKIYPFNKVELTPDEKIELLNLIDKSISISVQERRKLAKTIPKEKYNFDQETNTFIIEMDHCGYCTFFLRLMSVPMTNPTATPPPTMIMKATMIQIQSDNGTPQIVVTLSSSSSSSSSSSAFFVPSKSLLWTLY